MKHIVKLGFTAYYETDVVIDAESANAAMDLAVKRYDANTVRPFQNTHTTDVAIISVEYV